MLLHHHTDNNKVVDLLYVYFQKSFDNVPHETPMGKINAHGIQGDAARWIQNRLVWNLIFFHQTYIFDIFQQQMFDQSPRGD